MTDETAGMPKQVQSKEAGISQVKNRQGRMACSSFENARVDRSKARRINHEVRADSLTQNLSRFPLSLLILHHIFFHHL